MIFILHKDHRAVRILFQIPTCWTKKIFWNKQESNTTHSNNNNQSKIIINAIIYKIKWNSKVNKLTLKASLTLDRVHNSQWYTTAFATSMHFLLISGRIVDSSRVLKKVNFAGTCSSCLLQFYTFEAHWRSTLLILYSHYSDRCDESRKVPASTDARFSYPCEYGEGPSYKFLFKICMQEFQVDWWRTY